MAIKDKKSLAAKNVVNEIPNAPESAPEPISEAIPEISVNPFQFRLVVRNRFNRYRKGHIIYSAQEIAAVIDSGNLANCNKIKI